MFIRIMACCAGQQGTAENDPFDAALLTVPEILA